MIIFWIYIQPSRIPALRVRGGDEDAFGSQCFPSDNYQQGILLYQQDSSLHRLGGTKIQILNNGWEGVKKSCPSRAATI
jgi:hypothetical protein